jgi:hypothetical protein
MPADLNKYGNTYDITAKKWVKDMTDSELKTYGYKEKKEEEDGEEGQALQTVASKTRAKKTVA